MEKMLNEITVTSQEELDNIPLDFKGYINIKFGTVIEPAIVKHKYSPLYDQVRVCKYDQEVFYVKAINNANVSVYGCNIAISVDNAIIKAYDNSIITSRDNSTVYSYNNSKVCATDNSVIYARDKSVIKSYKNSKVNAYDNSHVLAEDNVEIYVFGDSSIIAYYGCKVHTASGVYLSENTSKPFIYNCDKS